MLVIELRSGDCILVMLPLEEFGELKLDDTVTSVSQSYLLMKDFASSVKTKLKMKYIL